MKVLITDLDRTLLRTDKSLSAYTIDVLKKCRDCGILLMAASARPLRDIQPFDRLIGFDAITATNGAVISLPDQRLEFGIQAEIGEKILSDLLRFPDLFLSVETSRGLYSNREIPAWHPVVYDSFPHLPDNAILYKILASSTCNQLYAGVKDILPNDVYYTLAGKELVQIMSVHASKWRGVKHMLSCFGLSPADAVYFGDDHDDIEPVKNCGLGVAVANAIPPVLNVADHIAPNNDQDGVAQFIEEKILQKE